MNADEDRQEGVDEDDNMMAGWASDIAVFPFENKHRAGGLYRL